MTINIQTLISAVDTAGGRFGRIHGYKAKNGIVSDVELRLGASYLFMLRDALQKTDGMGIGSMAIQYGLDFPTAYDIYKKQVAAWERSIDRIVNSAPPVRADNTTSIGTTKTGSSVIRLNKASDALILQGFKVPGQTKYDAATLPTEKFDGCKVLSRKLESYCGFRRYTLRPDNFDRVSVQGLVITPDDIASMLEELRKTA